MGKTRQVIIGNSAAGLAAIKAIREVDTACPITLISAENGNAYSPVLTTYYLSGRISRENIFIVNSDFYKITNVRTVLGSKAVGLDTSKQLVHLENDGDIEYDNLLIATGASARGLDVPGARLDNVLSLRTIKDADKILELSKRAKEIIVVGAGLVSLQILSTLLREGVKFTVLASSGQVLSQNVDADYADIVQKEIQSLGISLLFGRNVKKVVKRGDKALVISDSGEEWIADMVIVGKGVRPNIQLVIDSGIKVNRGILADEFMRTNISNVYTAGDVTEGKNLLSGTNEIIPNWNNATKQGRIAGLNMAGREQRFAGGFKENISTIFGMTVAAIGVSQAQENDGLVELKYSDPERKVYRKILLDGNRMVGAILLNRTEDAGIISNFIRNRTNISPWKDSISKTPLNLRNRLLSTNRSLEPWLYHIKGKNR